uniref:Uncharacterized protein n=1 Tax=Acrobeloides nanus TaxID=290746 RepID=A0A914DAU3_9BILA
MATTLQKWLNVIPGMMWLVSILLLIFYLTKSTSKPYLIATYVYFLLTSAAQGFMVGLSIYIAVGSLDLWQWAG